MVVDIISNLTTNKWKNKILALKSCYLYMLCYVFCFSYFSDCNVQLNVSDSPVNPKIDVWDWQFMALLMVIFG